MGRQSDSGWAAPNFDSCGFSAALSSALLINHNQRRGSFASLQKPPCNVTIGGPSAAHGMARAAAAEAACAPSVTLAAALPNASLALPCHSAGKRQARIAHGAKRKSASGSPNAMPLQVTCHRLGIGLRRPSVHDPSYDRLKTQSPPQVVEKSSRPTAKFAKR